ncbi:MAG: hypothetical protein ACYC64_08130 [Armatimonadota bacterium]
MLSFESSDSGPWGDILSKRTAKDSKLKVGMLGCGYFEYWRMFSDEFKQNVIGDLEKVADRLRQDFEVVYPCVVDSLDAAEIAGQEFAKSSVDVLIVVEGTYVPDFITLHAIDFVPNVPVIMFTTQTEEDISPTDNYEALMRNSALIGTAQLSGTFQKMGRPYEIVVGSIGEERPYLEISKLIRTQHVAKRLKNFSIGVIGHVFRGMYDLENDKTKIKAALGPDVIYVEMSHLLRQWEKVTDEEASAVADKMASRFTMRGTTKEELVRSCKLGIAMERLIDHLNLDALCFLGQHYIEKEVGAPARIGASMILDKGKHIIASEGDLAGLVLMQAMTWLTGNSPLQAEWGQYDATHNAVFIVGHGLGSASLASSDKAITLTRSPEEWGFEGSGANIEFILKPGVVTMAHLLHTAKGWQMLISRGESVEYPCLPCDEIHGLIRVDIPVKDYLVKIQKKGVPHHVIVVHSDICRELELLAQAMGVESFVV